MSFRSLLIIAACAAFPFMASALSMKKLPEELPEDMCALDAKIPEQATIISYLSSSVAAGNELVASFASCDELKAIANKKATSVSHYGSVLKQAAIADMTMDRAMYVASVATAFAKSAELTKAALAGAESLTAQGANVSGAANPSGIGAVSKGVLYQDPRMVIIGMEQTNNFGTSQTRVASTAGMTLIGNTPVSVNLYAPLSDKDAFANSAEALKPTLNRMIRDNNQ